MSHTHERLRIASLRFEGANWAVSRSRPARGLREAALATAAVPIAGVAIPPIEAFSAEWSAHARNASRQA
jgi:hypothetical protein